MKRININAMRNSLKLRNPENLRNPKNLRIAVRTIESTPPDSDTINWFTRCLSQKSLITLTRSLLSIIILK